jgi:hypothetical protein
MWTSQNGLKNFGHGRILIGKARRTRYVKHQVEQYKRKVRPKGFEPLTF